MNVSSSQARLAVLTAAAALVAGCGNGDRRYEITEKRELAAPRPEQLVPADTRTRFSPAGSGEVPSPHGAMAGMGAPSQSPLAFDLPEGWKEIPAAQFRSPNFAVPAREKLECYVSVLPGAGGGIAPNVNRWRKQMGLAEMSDADVAALPRVKFLGGDAPFVEMDGTYKGAGAQSATPGYTMAAVAAERGGAVITAKLVGPTDDVHAELDRFKAMCASLRSSAPAASGGVVDGGDGGALTWKAPEGWTQGPPKQMRVVTFTPDGRPGVECYITVLAGRAGGVEANMNRWRQQLSLAPLTAEAIAALPKVQVLGRPSPLVEVDGGKLGLYGLVCELDSQTVFVKMTGPMDALRAERDRFVEFCRSLGRP
jgi:hypothetical protein